MTPKSSRFNWLFFAPIIFLFLWSAGYAVAKIALEYSPPLTMLLLRFGCVVVIMAVLFVIFRPPLPKSKAELGHLVFVGILIQAVYFGMSYIAFDAGVAAGTAALIMSFQPILVSIIAPKWAGETVSWQQWFGLLLGLMGTAIVIIAKSSVEAPTYIGFFCAFLALMGITIGSLWEKKFGKSHHPITSNLIGFTSGFIVILPVVLLLEDMTITWTWEFAAAMGYLVIGNSVIAVGLLLAMIRAGEVSKVSALLYLVPPLAALIAWFLVGEAFPPVAWIGIAIAAAGVYLSIRKAKA